MVLEHLEPALVWQIFEEVFTKTPRESKHEEKIRAKIQEWVQNEAQKRNILLKISSDAAGNILISVPGTPNHETEPPILFQGHCDMVCETDRDDGFDFENESIPVQIEANNEWVVADHTTLGADNGLGVAMALALIFDKDVVHGPLEILITVDEETGLTGAFELDTETLPIKSRFLVNIDSESVKTITIGSAGGGGTDFEKNFKYITVEEQQKLKLKYYQLEISGLFGGHSGGDIHLPRGNAIKIVGRIMSDCLEFVHTFVGKWNGGSKHNAIPRSSLIKFAVLENHEELLKSKFEEAKNNVLAQFLKDEKDLKIELQEAESFSVIDKEDSRNLVYFMQELKHGALKFSSEIPDLVETSNNVAVISTENNHVHIHCSSRSNVDSELAKFRRNLMEIGVLFDWEVVQEEAYPGWAPDPTSPFLKYVQQQFLPILGEEPDVKAIHAGLECGIIGAKIPGIQMVSIGPIVNNPHTPDERANIASVQTMYKILKGIVAHTASL